MDEYDGSIEEELAELQKETWYETFIRYGLFIGAIIQLMCLGACLFLPHPSPSGDSEDVEVIPDQNIPTSNTPKRQHFRSRRQDKKKRR